MTQVGHFLSLPFLDHILTRSACCCVFLGAPLPLPPPPPTGSCPSLCRLSSQPANWPPFSLVSLSPSWVLSPELCHKDIKSYTLPQVNTEILNVAPHSITPRDDPVPSVGSLVRRFSPWSTATWAGVEGLGSHSKSCAIWPHPNLELHLVLYLCRHLVFQL